MVLLKNETTCRFRSFQRLKIQAHRRLGGKARPTD
jgi:hypothetical protein